MSANILIIEDNLDNRKLCMRILNLEGYQCEGVTSAEEGLARLEEVHFDAVLMDILLPGMDGKEATRHLRGNPKFQQLPIIAVTAHAIETAKVDILASGVTTFVAKPIDVDDFLKLVRSLLPPEARTN